MPRQARKLVANLNLNVNLDLDLDSMSDQEVAVWYNDKRCQGTEVSEVNPKV